MFSVPNLLESRPGRMTAFFLLYVCEGLPQGLAAGAVALEFKRMHMEGKAIAAFLALILLPWAWKWIAGPFVDNLHLRRFGKRKQWIVFCQIGMIITLLFALAAFPKSPAQIAFFTGIVLIHNIFAACQDVAIDGLACATLMEHERGLANGLMFAGAQAGIAVGGSGVIYLKGALGFHGAALIVPVCIAAILAMIVTCVRENKEPAEKLPRVESAIARTFSELLTYIADVLRVFFTTKRGFLGMLLALLPLGGMALSLTISKVLSPTLGMTDNEIASLDLVSSLVFIGCCISGGFLSDRFGRRKTMTVSAFLTLVPTLWIGWRMQQEGWIELREPLADGTWERHGDLIHSWWLASIGFSVFNGLMYGVRSAFFMDILEPRVATTQFTAFMALMNICMQYSYWWQGQAVTSVANGGWGFTYFQIFLLDAALGALFVILLPFARNPHTSPSEAVEKSPA